MITDFEIRLLSPLDTRKYSVPGEFVLLADYAIAIKYRGMWYREVVPRGFITDFASVPGVVQLIPGFGVNENSAYSAVAHDYHYCRQGFLNWIAADAIDVTAISLSRDECDQLLYAGLVAMGYSPVEAAAFYQGVRLGGASHWDTRQNGLNLEIDFVHEDYWSQLPCAT